MKKNKTVYAKKQTVKKEWYVVDAGEKILGRVATKVALYLRGKHKPIFTPHTDCGDYIVIINADRIRLSGKKAGSKLYFSHSGYPGGMKLVTFEKMMVKDPRKVVRLAVEGMLPKSRLGKKMINNLKIYVGKDHPHQAQKLQKLEV